MFAWYATTLYSKKPFTTMLNLDRYISLPVKITSMSLQELCGVLAESYYTGILDDIDEEYQTVYLVKAYRICGTKVEWLETLTLPIADIIDINIGDEILKS